MKMKMEMERLLHLRQIVPMMISKANKVQYKKFVLQARMKFLMTV